MHLSVTSDLPALQGVAGHCRAASCLGTVAFPCAAGSASVTGQVAAAGECADAALQPVPTARGSSSPGLHALLK